MSDRRSKEARVALETGRKYQAAKEQRISFFQCTSVTFANLNARTKST